MMETHALICLTLSSQASRSHLLFLILFFIITIDILKNIPQGHEQRVFSQLEGRDQAGRSKASQGRKASIWHRPGQCKLHGGPSASWVQTY